MTSEYYAYCILPALSVTSEYCLYCILPFSTPVGALPAIPTRTNMDPHNPHDEQYASRSSLAVAMGGTVTVKDVGMLFG